MFYTKRINYESHNPYFNRWFSAINFKQLKISDYVDSHNPYFNRWFSAMRQALYNIRKGYYSHNPYFNRWFSAIGVTYQEKKKLE